ncbi:MAG: hypothetical protein JW716_01670 [Candidatus Aenigmarchaeota archaeon]|nr:hypothetical protein [Candidatus Aenigmarchaeota archaeon]
MSNYRKPPSYKKILIIESESIIAEEIQMRLLTEGYQSDKIMNESQIPGDLSGYSGIFCGKGKPDQNTPIVIRTKDKEVPIIGMNFFEGVDYSIPKPFTDEEFAGTITYLKSREKKKS